MLNIRDLEGLRDRDPRDITPVVEVYLMYPIPQFYKEPRTIVFFGASMLWGFALG